MQCNKRRRAPRTTNAQYSLMLDFCRKHSVLLNSRQCVNQGSAKDTDILWKKLAHALNNSGSGASKSVDQWKRTWVEWKSNTKRRCREVLMEKKNGLKGRGLTDLEQRLMELINTSLTLDTPLKEEKADPLDSLEMVLENSNSNIHPADFEQSANNREPIIQLDNPSDFQSACAVISNSLNGVALAIRELAASQYKMAEANIQLAEVIIQQMQMTKK